MSTQRTVHSELDPLLKELCMPAMRSTYREVSATAEKESLTYEEYLLQLAQNECASRHSHRVEQLTRESRLPLEKTMLNFERQRLSRPANAQISTLLDGSFSIVGKMFCFLEHPAAASRTYSVRWVRNWSNSGDECSSHDVRSWCRNCSVRNNRCAWSKCSSICRVWRS